MISALSQARSRIQNKAAVILLFCFRMAFIAAFFEDRQDLGLEKTGRFVDWQRKFLSDCSGNEATSDEEE